MRIALALLLSLSAVAPASAQMRKFEDWLAACDNARNCVAYSWNRGSYNAYLRIRREGTPSADATLTLAISRDKPTSFRIEDKAEPRPFPSGEIKDLPVGNDGHIRASVEVPAAKLAAWVRATPRLEVFQVDPPMEGVDDQLIDGIPLRGALAALAWIDERQARAGSETAFVKRGRKPVAALALPPALPRVTAAKPDDAAVPEQPPPEIAKRANATCGKGSIDAEHKRTVRLAAGQLLHWFFCGQHSGAAGMNHAFLLMPDGKPKAPAKPRFALPPQVARQITLESKIPANKDAVFNPEFDPATLTLTSVSIWRAAGDCGEILTWVWSGTEFQLSEFRGMPHCEGIPPSDWPVLYQAQVKWAP